MALDITPTLPAIVDAKIIVTNGDSCYSKLFPSSLCH